jgi:hypothetical protein
MNVGFEVLTAVSMKMAVFWVVNFYQTTRCYNPEDSHLQGNEPSGSIKCGEFLD